MTNKPPVPTKPGAVPAKPETASTPQTDASSSASTASTSSASSNSIALAPTATADAPKVALSDPTSLSDADLNAMLKALRMEVRRRAKELDAKRPQVGSLVRILRGRPKYVGKVGTAVFIRKTRCFVRVPEIVAPAYVLVTDVELVEQ